MIIAREKKKSNIAEYVLYMWQVEDIIRAHELDIEKIETNIILQFGQPEDVRADIRDWYEGLIEMMRIEGKKEKGHLQINLNTVMDLVELHGLLLGNPKQVQYQQCFTDIYPILEEFKGKSKAAGLPDIEVLFNALYSFWLLKLQKREISKETQEAIQSFSELIRLLSQAYHQRADGTLEI